MDRFRTPLQWIDCGRGVEKQTFIMMSGIKFAPSTGLRKWFHAGGGDFTERTQRYIAELTGAPEHWQPLLSDSKRATANYYIQAKMSNKIMQLC